MDYVELEKGLPFRTRAGADRRIRVNMLTDLPLERQVLALERLRKIVETDDLDGYDCTITGCKNNECSWGMCQQNKKLWPDPQDYVWPHEKGRVVPLSPGPPCPLMAKGIARRGCFFRCRFFQDRYEMLRREEVLDRIDYLISTLRYKISELHRPYQ